MKSQMIPIILIFVGVIVIFWMYKNVQENEVKSKIMTNPVLTKIAIDNANADGITFGEALNRIAKSTTDKMY